MKKKTVLIVISIVLVLATVLVSVSMCSNKVIVRDGTFEYDGNTYSYLDRNYASWYPVLSEDMIEKVGRNPLFPLYPLSCKPIYATTEATAVFLIVSYRSYFHRLANNIYIRSDIELTPVFDTAYQKVVVRYDDHVSEEGKCFDEYPEGTTFKDIIGDGEKTVAKNFPTSYVHYCVLDCIYPEIDYLQCSFDIYRDVYGQLYLKAEDNLNEIVYYKISVKAPSGVGN